MLLSTHTSQHVNSSQLLALLLACTFTCACMAGPTELDPSDLGGDLGFVWDQTNVNRKALRFVGTGSGYGDDDSPDFDLLGTSSLAYQDGSDPPWVDEGLLAPDMKSFDFGIWNQSADTFDGLILLVAYKGDGADFTLSLDSTPFPSSEFHTLGDYSIFKGGGNRPVDGEAALYNSANGVIFIDLDAGLGPDSDQWWGESPPNADLDDTLMNIHAEVGGATLPRYLHFDAYGYIYGDSPDIVTGTNATSGDLTAVPEASTMVLFGSGLLGLFRFARGKAKSGRRS